MNTFLSGCRPLLVAGGMAVAVGAVGCGKSEAATARPGSTETPAVGGARADTESYAVEIKAGGPYKAGAEGMVEVTLTPKGGYHTNDQYPYKFKAADPPPDGVTFPKPVLQRADGSFEKARGSFRVPFVAAKAGKFTIGGTLSLSVCSDANCIMDKVPLDVPVDVK
jgi:hypothetical protein